MTVVVSLESSSGGHQQLLRVLDSCCQAFGCSIEAAALCALLSGPPVWQRSALENCCFSAKGAAQEGRCPRASAARQRLTLSQAVLGAVEGDPLTALNVFNIYLDVKRTEGPEAASRWAERHLVDESVMARAATMHKAMLQWMQRCQLPRVSLALSTVGYLRFRAHALKDKWFTTLWRFQMLY